MSYTQRNCILDVHVELIDSVLLGGPAAIHVQFLDGPSFNYNVVGPSPVRQPSIKMPLWVTPTVRIAQYYVTCIATCSLTVKIISS